MDGINYDNLIQAALRDVARRTLKQVEENGLPGLHHFYITFRTDRADVEIPEGLRRDHPNEVTIVLQHQFWDLEAAEHYFAVTLSFGGQRERLKIPYGALISFMDPSVKFGLQFAPEEPTAVPNEPGITPAEVQSRKSNIVTLDAFRKNNKKK